ncbi:MAG: ABC transporter ATP-binding protein [Anaerolineae bacterium]|nr:ABC transporter ATP-binding protein [Anaerolineae bacterium]NUQ03480.1 ABC transporter ATP-binding protein [Anaerolineae bacterium]
MTTVTLTHVSKKFSGYDGMMTTALDNVSLKAHSGEVIAVLGPSGCGKSSLLRIIAGLLPPDGGEVLYDNVSLAEIPLRERGVGMVFQDGALMPHWVAEKTVGFFLSLRHREAEVPARMRRISEITGIGMEKLLDRKPGQLSGGERQRVAIARALARDPRVFLFDEPFSSIDAALRTHARLELKRLLREFPVTSFYVTHDQQEAVAMATRIAVMRAGRVEQMGDYQTLYENPLNLFVAAFIGTPTINLFSGTVRHHHWYGGTFGGFSVRSDLDDGAPVVAGVRPEAFRIAPSDDAVPVRAESVVDHYSERLQVVEVLTEFDRWTITVPLDLGVKAGDVLPCALDASMLVYFDPRSGRRIG